MIEIFFIISGIALFLGHNTNLILQGIGLACMSTVTARFFHSLNGKKKPNPKLMVMLGSGCAAGILLNNPLNLFFFAALCSFIGGLFANFDINLPKIRSKIKDTKKSTLENQLLSDRVLIASKDLDYTTSVIKKCLGKIPVILISMNSKLSEKIKSDKYINVKLDSPKNLRELLTRIIKINEKILLIFDYTINSYLLNNWDLVKKIKVISVTDNFYSLPIQLRKLFDTIIYQAKKEELCAFVETWNVTREEKEKFKEEILLMKETPVVIRNNTQGLTKFLSYDKTKKDESSLEKVEVNKLWKDISYT